MLGKFFIMNSVNDGRIKLNSSAHLASSHRAYRRRFIIFFSCLPLRFEIRVKRRNRIPARVSQNLNFV